MRRMVEMLSLTDKREANIPRLLGKKVGSQWAVRTAVS